MSRRTNWTRAAVLGLTACLLLGLCACAEKNNAQDASDDDSYANLTRKIVIGAHREAPDDEPDSEPDSLLRASMAKVWIWVRCSFVQAFQK